LEKALKDQEKVLGSYQVEVLKKLSSIGLTMRGDLRRALNAWNSLF
jgi:hypothetical protein